MKEQDKQKLKFKPVVIAGKNKVTSTDILQ